MLTAGEGFGDQDACGTSKGNKDEAADRCRRATAGLPPGRPCGSAITTGRRGIALRVEFVKASRALTTRVAWLVWPRALASVVCGAVCHSVQLPVVDLLHTFAATEHSAELQCHDQALPGRRASPLHRDNKLTTTRAIATSAITSRALCLQHLSGALSALGALGDRRTLRRLSAARGTRGGRACRRGLLARC